MTCKNGAAWHATGVEAVTVAGLGQTETMTFRVDREDGNHSVSHQDSID